MEKIGFKLGVKESSVQTSCERGWNRLVCSLLAQCVCASLSSSLRVASAASTFYFLAEIPLISRACFSLVLCKAGIPRRRHGHGRTPTPTSPRDIPARIVASKSACRSACYRNVREDVRVSVGVRVGVVECELTRKERPEQRRYEISDEWTTDIWKCAICGGHLEVSGRSTVTSAILAWYDKSSIH